MAIQSIATRALRALVDDGCNKHLNIMKSSSSSNPSDISTISTSAQDSASKTAWFFFRSPVMAIITVALMLIFLGAVVTRLRWYRRHKLQKALAQMEEDENHSEESNYIELNMNNQDPGQKE